MKYRIELLCPVCNATDAVTVADKTDRRYRCGDCLIERVEIVTMTVVGMTEVDDVGSV